MSQVATGNAASFAWGRSRSDQFGVPAPGLTGLNAILPVTGEMVGGETPSTAVNPNGFVLKGVPGPKGGPMDVGFPLTAGRMAPFLEHIFGQMARQVPAPGVFQLDATPSRAPCSNTDFWGLTSKGGVERFYWYGAKFAVMTITIGDNAEIPVRLTGQVTHGTYLGAAAPSAGNTGTYTLGPWIRGVVKDKAAGSVWWRVEGAAPDLTFKVLQASAEPDAAAWAAAATVFTAVLMGGEHRFQNLQSSATGLDLGIWDANKDPLELIVPGGAAEHADLAAGDVFEFPITWNVPALTTPPAGDKLSSAHWVCRFRPLGSPTWIELPVDSGVLTFTWDLSIQRGNQSRYAHDLNRPGIFTPTVTLARSFVDRFFADAADRHQRIEMQVAFEGRQLDANHRESLVFDYPNVNPASTRPASGPTEIKEALILTGESDETGSVPPCTARILTDQDFTPYPLI